MPVWAELKLQLPQRIRATLPGFSGDLYFADHHESHAASAFFPSPFDAAAILTVDAVGEWSTSALGMGNGNRIASESRAALSALARHAVFGLHLLHRLPGEFGRIQADGPGTLRQAQLRRR